jgi:hypothetical protein
MRILMTELPCITAPALTHLKRLPIGFVTTKHIDPKRDNNQQKAKGDKTMTKSLEAENAALKKQVESLKNSIEHYKFKLESSVRQHAFWYEFAAKNYPENPSIRAAAILKNQRDMDETSVAEFETVLGPWLDYKDDFDILTDREIERRLKRSRKAVMGNQAFIAAVASWEIAGKPRTKKAKRVFVVSTDGNLNAINQELERQERYDAAQLVYCLNCNESMPIKDWPDHEYQGTCPNCETALEDMK